MATGIRNRILVTNPPLQSSASRPEWPSQKLGGANNKNWAVPRRLGTNDRKDSNLSSEGSLGVTASTLCVASGVEQSVSSLTRDGRRRVHAVYIVAVLILLSALMHLSTRTSSAEGTIEEMASQIVELSRQVGSVNDKAKALEEEERGFKRELAQDMDEIQRLRLVEEELQEKEKEIQRLIAQAQAVAEEEADGKNLRRTPGQQDEAVAAEMLVKLNSSQRAMQERDKESVLGKYGPGPHKLRVVMKFPPGSPEGPNGRDSHSFVIQLAPLDLMPHTIRFVLDQVDAGLWNGCSFHRNTDHIIQAGFWEKDEEIAQRFKEKGLLNLSLQEYSPDFPHDALTVGMGGRPSGPLFYINKIDNTQRHGPGGQKHVYKTDDADPCFGEIIRGMDAVERLGRMPTDPGSAHQYMKDYVTIKHVGVFH